MLAQVKELEEGLGESDKDIVASIQKVELERVKFIIASYLRQRLQKIEQYSVHTLETEAKSETSKLSAAELEYAKTFADGVQNHLHQLTLSHMPVNMQTMEQKKTVPRANMDKYVFVRVKEAQENVMIDPEEEPFDLDANTQHIVRYNPVGPFVESGAVCLI